MIARTAADLGSLIRERRRELGLRQDELAERVGASRLWVIEIEQGKPRAELGLVLRALAALGLEVDVTSADARPTPKVHNRAGGKRPRAALPPDIDTIVSAARKRS